MYLLERPAPVPAPSIKDTPRWRAPLSADPRRMLLRNQYTYSTSTAPPPAQLPCKASPRARTVHSRMSMATCPGPSTAQFRAIPSLPPGSPPQTPTSDNTLPQQAQRYDQCLVRQQTARPGFPQARRSLPTRPPGSGRETPPHRSRRCSRSGRSAGLLRQLLFQGNIQALSRALGDRLRPEPRAELGQEAPIFSHRKHMTYVACLQSLR